MDRAWQRASRYDAGPLRHLLCALVLGLLTLAGGARAAEAEGSLRVTGRLLLDGNAPRDFSDGTTPAQSADWVLSLLAAGEGRYTADRWQLVGRYDVGGRKYLFFPQEDALVQAAALEGSLALGSALGLGVEGRGKDRRGGSRAYTDGGAALFAEYAPDARLALRARTGLHRFLYWPAFAASHGGLEVGLLARYRLDRRHTFSLSGDYGARHYSVQARPFPWIQPTPRPTRREDGALSVSAGWTYRGPLALGVTYAYQEVGSNSFGETVVRHRLSASAGVRLPWSVMLLAQGALGLSHYPDGVYLSPEIVLLEDDEGQNTLSLKLARPLGAHLDVELSYAAYGTRLPRNGLSYFRQVAGVGLTWRP